MGRRLGDAFLCAGGDALEEELARVLLIADAVGVEVEEDFVLALGAALRFEMLGEDVEPSGEEGGGDYIVVAVGMNCVLEEADGVVVGKWIALVGAGAGLADAEQEERRNFAELEDEAGFARAAGLNDGGALPVGAAGMAVAAWVRERLTLMAKRSRR